MRQHLRAHQLDDFEHLPYLHPRPAGAEDEVVGVEPRDAVLELLRDEPYARALGQMASTDVVERFATARLLRDVQALYMGLLNRKGVRV